MMHMRKLRLIPLLLAIIILSLLLVQGYAAEADPTPNRQLLEAMLNGDRHWVIETLVEDSRSNNPMAIQYADTGRKSLAHDALDTYRGIDAENQTLAAVYKSMVDIMEKYYSKEEYINGLVDEGGNLLSWLAGIFTGKDEVEDTIDDLTASTDELRYESLLKAIFSEEYTASDGTMLGDSEDTLILVRQIKDTLSYLRKFVSLGRSEAASIVGAADLTQFDSEYIDKYALPYIEACSSFFSSLGQLQSSDSSKDAAAMADIAAALAAINSMSMAAPSGSYLGYSYYDFLAGNIVDNGVLDALSSAGKTLKIADTYLDSYLYINSIQGQKESFSGGVARMADAAGYEDMRKALDYFSEMLSDEFDARLFSYDSIVRYLRENSTISSSVASSAKDLFKKLFHISSTSIAGAAISETLAVADITGWVADQAVGLKDTCKKTYELLYWEKLTDLCVELYYADLSSYRSNSSDENAAIVIDDLLLLQKMRLYGEKIAYGLAAGQIDSALGKIFWDGSKEAYDTLYKCSVDELIAACVVPPLDGVTVESGDVIMIEYNESTGYVGTINRGGKIIHIPELSSRLAGGLTVNGQLGIYGDPSVPLGIAYLSASPGAGILSTSGQVVVDELYCSGGTLNIKLLNDAVLKVTGTLDIADCTFSSEAGNPLEANDLTLRGAFTGGDLVVSGDVTTSGGSAEVLTLASEGKQSILGTGSLTCGNLNILCGELDVSGKVTVSGALNAPAAKITGGKNILLSGGRLASSAYDGDLSAKSAVFSGNTITGSLFDSGSSVYLGLVTVEGNLSLSGTPSFSDGSRTKVLRYVSIDCESIGGSCALECSGDVAVSGSAAVSELTLCGEAPQELTGELSAGTLVFDNQKGVDIVGGAAAEERLVQKADGAVTGNAVKLGNNAVMDGNTFHGNLSVLDYHLNGETLIDGDLTVRAGGGLSGAPLEITGALNAPGDVTITGAEISANSLSTKGNLTTDNPLTIDGTATCAGTVNTSSYMAVFGDLISTSFTCNGELRVKGDLTGGLNATTLILDGSHKQYVYGTVKTSYFEIRNTSSMGVQIDGSVYASISYKNTGVPVKGNAVHVGEGGMNVEVDTELSGDQTVDGALNLKNSSMRIDGSLNASKGLTLENAQLIITGDLIVGGGSIVLDGNSSLTIVRQARIQNAAVTQDGTMSVGSDLYLSSSPITGGGSLTLNGDLVTTGQITQQTLTLGGKVRQYIDGGQVNVRDLILENSSKGGVYLQSKIYYSGSLDPGSTAVTNEQNLIKEAA